MELSTSSAIAKAVLLYPESRMARTKFAGSTNSAATGHMAGFSFAGRSHAASLHIPSVSDRVARVRPQPYSPKPRRATLTRENNGSPAVIGGKSSANVVHRHWQTTQR